MLPLNFLVAPFFLHSPMPPPLQVLPILLLLLVLEQLHNWSSYSNGSSVSATAGKLTAVRVSATL
jgi:hypothetical protein